MKPADAENLLRPALIPVWISVGFLWLLHWLPLSLQAALGNALGWLLSLLPGKRRRVVATNLALCFPDTPEPVRKRWLRQTFQASMRAVLEHGMLWWGSEARVRRLIQIDNPEAALGDGVRPVIWLAPHFVGLDMGGVRLTMDQQIASMYAPAKNPVDRQIHAAWPHALFGYRPDRAQRRSQVDPAMPSNPGCLFTTCRTRTTVAATPCSSRSSA